MADIFSVILGGALAIGGGFVTQLWQHHRDRRALALALAGEIHAIVDIIERRKYTEAITALISQISIKNEPMTMHVPVTQNYFVVYESNAAKIGLLPSNAARDVAVFYTIAKGVIEDAGLKQFPPATATDAIFRLSQTQALLADMTKLGKQVVLKLEAS